MSGKQAIIASDQLAPACWARSVVPVLAASSNWATGDPWMTRPSWARSSGMRYPTMERTELTMLLARIREVKVTEKVNLLIDHIN